MSDPRTKYIPLHYAPLHGFMQFVRFIALLVGVTGLRILYGAIEAGEWNAAAASPIILIFAIMAWRIYGRVRKVWGSASGLKIKFGRNDKEIAWTELQSVSHPWWAPGPVGSLQLLQLSFKGDTPKTVVATTDENRLALKKYLSPSSEP